MRDAAERRIAVGFFDGVHLGHRAILKGADAVLTFRNHPLSVLDPPRSPRLIMSFAERVAAIRSLGVGEVTALDFDARLAQLDPVDFLDRYLKRSPGVETCVRCGPAWRFGRGGAGNAGLLRDRGYAVAEVEPALYAGERISSSRIRAALEAGSLADANAMLGAPFAVKGTRFAGKGCGARLGFPTVNLKLERDGPSPRIRLPLGVYEVAVGAHRGIANWGVAPTFGGRAWTEPVMEIHFVDEGWRALSAAATVSMLRFIRGERAFESEAALRDQIAADVAEVKR